MTEPDDNVPETSTEEVDNLLEQAEGLCQRHDHITRVIADLEFSGGGFEDQYTRDSPVQFGFEAILRTFLYMEVRGFGQSEVHSRLRNWPFIQVRFGLDRAPTQQTLSYARRHRLSHRARKLLVQAAKRIREVAREHDVLRSPARGPPIQPEERGEKGLSEDEILRAVRVARDRVFTEFTTDRAENAKYEDEVFWELQAYLSLVAHGKRGMKRRTTRLSWRSETPHGDTQLRAIKKMGASGSQTALSEFTNGCTPATWKRIRKTLLDPFDRAIENLIEETNFEDKLREPVNVAIDITPWQFYVTPWQNKELGIPKEDYPEMVSGYAEGENEGSKKKYKQGYKFATLTVIGENTPIVLAIEPVKNASDWEGEDAESMAKAEVVDRLLSKAEEYVDIHKVFADREFSTHRVRDQIDRRELIYLIPKPLQAEQDLEDIEDVTAHPTAEVAVRNNVPLTADGRTHDVDFMYVPSKRETDSYALFTTNVDVPRERVMGLVAQYRDRWMIENEYKSIKAHFLPTTSSKDYRVRLFYFVAGVLMYNVWRLTNLLLRQWFDVHLGEKPPLSAGEVAEILAFCIGVGYG